MPALLSSSACSKKKNKKKEKRIRNGMNKRTEDDVSLAHGRRKIGASVIRECRCAPQLKLVHCSVELVSDYCSLYPALNLSYCSGSAPSCVRLFEVGKSCSHVLLMLSLSVCLSFSVFLSPVFPASLNTEEEIWNSVFCLFCILFSHRILAFYVGWGFDGKRYWNLLGR